MSSPDDSTAPRVRSPELGSSRPRADALLLLGGLACTAGTLFACGGGDDPPPEDRRLFDTTASFVELPERRWVEIETGGDTRCARGDAYSFFVFRGDSSQIVFNLEGGGGCWNESTCDVSSPDFVTTVERARDDLLGDRQSGLPDMSNPENPFGGFTQVFIPYCTGDVHWGEAEGEYGGIRIQHQGLANARAALDWVYREIPTTTNVLVTGCSAGGYGSIIHAPGIFSQYPDAIHAHLADSAAGATGEAWAQEALPSWGVSNPYPEWFMPSDLTAPDVLLQLYVAAAERFPDATFSQYNAVRDPAQVFFFTRTGGIGGESGFQERLYSGLEQLQRQPNFRSFTVNGLNHCIIDSNAFFLEALDGVRLADWVAGMVTGQTQETLACEQCSPEPP